MIKCLLYILLFLQVALKINLPFINLILIKNLLKIAAFNLKLFKSYKSFNLAELN